MACGIFSDLGSNLCLLHWQVDSLPLSHQGSPPVSLLILRASFFGYIVINSDDVDFLVFSLMAIWDLYYA